MDLYSAARQNGKRAWADYVLIDTIRKAKDGARIAIPQLNGPTRIITVSTYQEETP